MAAPLYFDAAHALLSDDALDLEATTLEAQAVVAEMVLGLNGTTLTDDDATQAGCAVALQINYQVSLPPEAWAVKRDKTGPLEIEYRDGMPEAYPPALTIVSVLLADDDDASSAAAGWNFWSPRR